MPEDDLAPTQWRTVEVRTDAACAVADLGSILEDLARVVERCELIRTGEYGDEINDALWEAAVIAYGRCFTEGRDARGRPGLRRQITSADLRVLDEVEIAVHRSLKVERNRHVGHRDDPLGEVALTVRLSDGAGATGISAFGLSLSRRSVTAARAAETSRVARRLLTTLRATFDGEMVEIHDGNST